MNCYTTYKAFLLESTLVYANRLKMTGVTHRQPMARETYRNRILQFFEAERGVVLQVDFDKFEQTFASQDSAREYAVAHINRLSSMD